jgi:hypothetical protein
MDTVPKMAALTAAPLAQVQKKDKCPLTDDRGFRLVKGGVTCV